MRIRPERRDEFARLHAFIAEAFKTAQRADGDEQDFVDGLRASRAYIPELALVAEREGEIVGHTLITHIAIETADGRRPALLLSELSVRLDARSQGVGARLVREALRRAEEFGEVVFVLGNPLYYGRFGFIPAVDFGVRNGNGVPDENFMALELTAEALAGVAGRVVLPGLGVV